MAYPEGLMIFGLPILLLGCGVDFAVRRLMRAKYGESDFDRERKIRFWVAAITLAILTVIYLLTKD